MIVFVKTKKARTADFVSDLSVLCDKIIPMAFDFITFSFSLQ